MVHLIRNTVFPSNTYLLTIEGSGSCIIIDPGLNFEEIDNKIRELDLVPGYVLSTHAHFDHAGTAAFFQDKYKSKFCIHQADLKLLKALNFYLKMVKLEMIVKTPKPDIVFSNYMSMDIAGSEIQVFNYPGHTDGSCIFLTKEGLFTGDLLYLNGIGTNPFPGQNDKKLQSSLTDILMRFDENLMIYPGHGRYGQLKEFKLNNPELSKFLSFDFE